MLFFLSVPLVTEGVDLVGKPGKVLVGPALVVLDDPQQALACADQALENRGGAAGTLTGPTLDPHSGALLHTDSPQYEEHKNDTEIYQVYYKILEFKSEWKTETSYYSLTLNYKDEQINYILSACPIENAL